MMEKDESRQTGGKQKITTVVDVYEKKKRTKYNKNDDDYYMELC